MKGDLIDFPLSQNRKMLETSVFFLYFSYIKACKCYRFFNATNQKQNKKPLLVVQLLMKLFIKMSCSWQKKVPSGFPSGECSSTEAFPSPWEVFATWNEIICSKFASSSVKKRMFPKRTGGMKPAECFHGLPFPCLSSKRVPGQVDPCTVSPVSWDASLA